MIRVLTGLGGLARFPLSLSALLHSVMGYAAGVWAHRARDVKTKILLRRTQRKVLLRFAGAFGTTSTMALLVVLGFWPIDLQIRLRGALYWLKNSKFNKIEEIIGFDARNKREMKDALIREWQEEWDTIEEGRRTHEIFPNIRKILRLTHLQPGPGLVHFLTGHGPYGVYLKRIKSRNNDNCDMCKVIDTPEHALFECAKARELCGDERQRLEGKSISEIASSQTHWLDLNTIANTISSVAKKQYHAI